MQNNSDYQLKIIVTWTIELLCSIRIPLKGGGAYLQILLISLASQESIHRHKVKDKSINDTPSNSTQTCDEQESFQNPIKKRSHLKIMSKMKEPIIHPRLSLDIRQCCTWFDDTFCKPRRYNVCLRRHFLEFKWYKHLENTSSVVYICKLKKNSMEFQWNNQQRWYQSDSYVKKESLTQITENASLSTSDLREQISKKYNLKK